MLILCLMLPSLSVQLVTINSISQYHVWEMTFWNVVRIVLEGYLHSIFVSTFRDINYITWTQNNVIILPRYFPIINLNQLSLNPTKEDISLLISPMSYKGRRNTRHNEQSICSRNSLTDKCRRVYWLPMRLLSTPSGYGSFLTNKGNDRLSFSTCPVDCWKSWPSGRGAVQTTEMPPSPLISGILVQMSVTMLFCTSSDPITKCQSRNQRTFQYLVFITQIFH